VSVTVYASVAQFTQRLPQTAWGARTVSDVQDALATASADMDDAFRGLYKLPFLAVGGSISRRCVDHARYLFLGGRGFSPENEADKDIVRAEEEFQTWLDKVQRRVLFPDVTIDPSATTTLPAGSWAQPTVASSCPRGWEGGPGPGGRGVW
jgi:phage gp36-like protein